MIPDMDQYEKMKAMLKRFDADIRDKIAKEADDNRAVLQQGDRVRFRHWQTDELMTGVIVSSRQATTSLYQRPSIQYTVNVNGRDMLVSGGRLWRVK